MARLSDPALHELVGGARPRRRCRRRPRRRSVRRIAASSDVERDDAGQRGEAAEQGGVRQRPAEVLARELRRRHGQQPLGPEAQDELAEAELVEASARC